MFRFNDVNLLKINQLKKRYPSNDALVLPCLWMIQYQEGYIPLEAIDTMSELIKVPPMEIYRVASFYTMFHLEPQEKLVVDVCKTLSCKLCGSDAILKHLQSNDKIRLRHVECLGSCGTAPVMQVKDIYYENLTLQKVDSILEKLL